MSRRSLTCPSLKLQYSDICSYARSVSTLATTLSPPFESRSKECDFFSGGHVETRRPAALDSRPHFMIAVYETLYERTRTEPPCTACHFLSGSLWVEIRMRGVGLYRGVGVYRIDILWCEKQDWLRDIDNKVESRWRLYTSATKSGDICGKEFQLKMGGYALTSGACKLCVHA